MQLNLNMKEICKISIAEVRKRLIVPREAVRVDEKHESHYRLLIWLGHQYENETLLDIGTRRGTSAVCLADNTANKVITFDIIAESKGYQHKDLFVHCPNVEFRQKGVGDIEDALLLLSPLIFLDIDHSGKHEDDFLTHLKKIGYDGFVFMDDVNFDRKFKGLRLMFEKHNGILLPRPISHDTGTGVVVFGENSINVRE